MLATLGKIRKLLKCPGSDVSPSSSKMSEVRPAFMIPYFYATGTLCVISICVAIYILVKIIITKAVVNSRVRGLMIIGLLCNMLQQSLAIYVYGDKNTLLLLETLIYLTILIYIGVQAYLTFQIFRSEDKLILGCLLL
jgi:hypothetical protein